MDMSTNLCVCGDRYRWQSGLRTFLQVALVYAVALTVTHAGHAPRFTQQPESDIVKESSKVSLRCSVAEEGAEIHWLYEGQNLTGSAASGVDVRGGRVVIQSFRRSSPGRPGHEGLYQCVASNSDGVVISLEAQLEAAYIGDFYEGPHDLYINVTEGNVAYIPCAPISGRPRPSMRFHLNGSELDTSSERYKVLPSGSLQIGGVRSRDVGVYRCLAYNPVCDEQKQAKRLVHLNVIPPISNHPPVFHVVPPSRVNVTRGHDLTLECVVEGAPVPVVTWVKYGGDLPLNRHKSVMGNLELYKVGRLDEGTYICNAHNTIGSGEIAIAQVDVLEPATLQSGPADQHVAMGTSASFQCQGRGKPVVTVQWFHNGVLMESGKGKGIISINDTTLTINQVQRKHVGVYQCIMKNSVGAITTSAQLSIAEAGEDIRHTNNRPDVQDQMQGIAPDMEHVHPFITTLPQNTTITEGGATILPCGTNQDHVEHGENFLWLRNSVTIERLMVDPQKGLRVTSRRGSASRERSQLRVLTSGSLQIINAQLVDTGQYTCVLWIDGNSDSASAYLTVLPLGTPATETSGGRNRPKNNPTPGGTTVSPSNTRRRGNKNNPDDIIEISEETKPTSGGRRQGNRPRGRPDEGIASLEGSDGDRMTDGDLVPPSMPQVSKLSDTSVMLEWSVPDNDGLPITFFKVQYKELVQDKHRRRWRTIDEDIPEHVDRFEVPGLKPGSTYRFRIVGVYSNNDNKHGPNSRKFTMETTPDTRTKVPLLGPVIVEARPLSESTIALKWQYLPEEGVPLEGFTMYYGPYGSQDNPETLTVAGAHVREKQIDHLQPNTVYSIKMKGFNIGGESDFSNTVVKRTLGDREYDYEAPTNWPGQVPDNHKPAVSSTESVQRDVEYTSNTEESSRMLYIVLGCVLGVMVLFLLFFMGMCAWKQRQRARMLVALEGRNKFEDQARSIYAQDSIRHKQMNGNGFLLNGIHNGNGSVSNGHPPGYTYPNMNITANPMLEDDAQETPTGYHHDNRQNGNNVQSIHELRTSLQEMLQSPPPPPPILSTTYNPDSHHDDHSDSDNRERYEANMSTFGRNRSRQPQNIALYDQPPEYHSIGSRRSNVPDHRPSPQLSLRSQTSSCYRVHDPHLTDHIPRSHDRQHYRRPDTRSSLIQPEADRMSDNSHSSSSQASNKHRHRRRKPTLDDHDVRDQSTNTDNENTLPNDSQVNHRLHASPSNHQHYHSNQYRPHSNPSPHHNNPSHYPNTSHDHDIEPHHGNQPHRHSNGPGHHGYLEHVDLEHDIDEEDEAALDRQLVVEDSEDASSEDRDYEMIPDSSPPPGYQSPDTPGHHSNTARLLGKQEYSDDDSLPEAPPSPPQLSRLPRIHDYPQTDPED